MITFVALAAAVACTASSSPRHRAAGIALAAASPAPAVASPVAAPVTVSPVPGSASTGAPVLATAPPASAEGGDSLSLAPTAFSSVFGQAQGGQVEVYATAGSSRPVERLPNPNPDGAPAVFLLTGGHSPHRVQVFLPERPNGSRGWLNRSQVHLYTNPYRLVVHVGAHRLQEFAAGHLVETDPVGIGRGVTPTPAGTYYLTELLQPPDPNGVYGPFAYGLSAYSPVLTDFAGGPGQIGLHGTNNPAGVGTDVSHGCLRLTNPAITRLAHTVPPGSPITIKQ